MDRVGFSDKIVDFVTFEKQLRDLAKKVTKLTDDFSSLENPKLFYEAYPHILKELNRRTLFT